MMRDLFCPSWEDEAWLPLVAVSYLLPMGGRSSSEMTGSMAVLTTAMVCVTNNGTVIRSRGRRGLADFFVSLEVAAPLTGAGSRSGNGV